MAERVAFYVWMRVLIRKGVALVRGNIHARQAWTNEWTRLRDQLDDLIDIKGKFQPGSNDAVMSSIGHDGRLFALCQSKYSRGVTPIFYLDGILDGEGVVRCGKAQEILASDETEYDAIITDPPYGFNATLTVGDLADLYDAMIPLFIRRLKDNGALVMCLPDEAYVRPQSPFFMTRRFIIHRILAAAVDLGKEVVQPSHVVPFGFRPPYYWESERALRRCILSFRFRNRE